MTTTKAVIVDCKTGAVTYKDVAALPPKTPIARTFIKQADLAAMVAYGKAQGWIP